MSPNAIVLATEDPYTFRVPIMVSEIHIYKDGEAYPVCPRCHNTFEREYQAYCDRCGQALGWKKFRQATIVRFTEITP